MVLPRLGRPRPRTRHLDLTRKRQAEGTRHAHHHPGVRQIRRRRQGPLHRRGLPGLGVDILGGCQGCHATIAAYNAYPSTSGYWRCADCIGNDGYATVADFTASASAPAACPSCGTTDNLSETRITTGERTEEYALECGDCGEVWQQ